VAANSLASAPFIMGIAVISSAIVYWLAGLNDSGGWARTQPAGAPRPCPPALPLPAAAHLPTRRHSPPAGDRFVYFFLNLYMALTTVEGLMMAIAAIVPHYLMGIAGGAGLMGMYMLVCGFFQTVDQLPKAVWRYPLHYAAFHSYAFAGGAWLGWPAAAALLAGCARYSRRSSPRPAHSPAGYMHNEFDGTTGWQCPCALQPGQLQCPADCTLTGEQVVAAWALNTTFSSKWWNLAIQAAMALAYRALFLVMLKLKERAATR
jgi:hypothetical protein